MNSLDVGGANILGGNVSREEEEEDPTDDVSLFPLLLFHFLSRATGA